MSENKSGQMAIIVCSDNRVTNSALLDCEGVVVQLGPRYAGPDDEFGNSQYGYQILPAVDVRARGNGELADGSQVKTGEAIQIRGLNERNLLVLPHPREVALFDLRSALVLAMTIKIMRGE